MPYTASQLSSFYTTLTLGAQPDAATTAAINTAASQDAAGTITDAQAFGAISYMSPQVRGTTDVAVSTYALFTGVTPSQAGINYLVNNPGTGYNTAYYNAGGTPASPGPGGFDIENRYYNAGHQPRGDGGFGRLLGVQRDLRRPDARADHLHRLQPDHRNRRCRLHRRGLGHRLHHQLASPTSRRWPRSAW